MSALCPGTRFQLIQTAIRMKHERTIFGAATLLLVVGAAITLASEGNSELEYENLIKFVAPKEIWNSAKRIDLMENLPDMTFSSEPEEMCDQLTGFLEEQTSTGRNPDPYVELFMSLTCSYDKKHCPCKYSAQIIEVFSTLDGIEKFKPYVELMTHYASKNFRPFAIDYLERLEKDLVGPMGWYQKKFDELFRAGLNDDGSEMCKLVSKVDLAKHKLDVRAMLHVANKYHKSISGRSIHPDGPLKELFEFIAKQCNQYKNLTSHEVIIINTVRFVRAIEENDVTCTFRLVNEYAYFCSRFLSEEDSGQIKMNFENWYK